MSDPVAVLGSPEWWSTNLLPAVTAAIALAGGGFGLIKWRDDQATKRLAAVFERIQSFAETPGTRNAMMILKSPRRPIPLYDPREPPARQYAMVSWDDAKWALVPTACRPLTDRKHNAIRDSFEDFMNRMTQIEVYIRAGRLSPERADPLVRPWAERLGGKIDDDGLTRNFRLYVEAEHRAVADLFRRYDVDLKPTDADRAAFAADQAARSR